METKSNIPLGDTSCSLSSLSEVMDSLNRYRDEIERHRTEVVNRRGQDPDCRFTIEKLKLMVILMAEEILQLGQDVRPSSKCDAGQTGEHHQSLRASQDSPDVEERRQDQRQFPRRLAQVLQS